MGFGPVFMIIMGSVIWIASALWVASMAKNRGRSFGAFLLLGLIFSFVIAWIVLLMMPRKNESAAEKADDEAVDRAIARDEARSE